MSVARRITAIFFTVVTSLGALWVALGWVSIAANGMSWSDGLAMMGFSAVLAALSLVCVALWGSHVRPMTTTFLVLFVLSIISFFAGASG